jgi:hypothetical protein
VQSGSIAELHREHPEWYCFTPMEIEPSSHVDPPLQHKGTVQQGGTVITDRDCFKIAKWVGSPFEAGDEVTFYVSANQAINLQRYTVSIFLPRHRIDGCS